MDLDLVMAEVMKDFQMSGLADGIYGDFVREVVKRMTAWQPIATAPKTGEAILAFSDGVQTTVKWCIDYEYWELCATGTGHLDTDEWNPTHWTPLHEAPN